MRTLSRIGTLGAENAKRLKVRFTLYSTQCVICSKARRDVVLSCRKMDLFSSLLKSHL